MSTRRPRHQQADPWIENANQHLRIKGTRTQDTEKVLRLNAPSTESPKEGAELENVLIENLRINETRTQDTEEVLRLNAPSIESLKEGAELENVLMRSVRSGSGVNNRDPKQ